MSKKILNIRTVVGWREWIALPELHIPSIKVKIDTGARTSALHADDVEAFREKGHLKVRFIVHPLQHRTDHVVHCVARVIDQRVVTDSGGHREKRYVIETPIQLGDLIIPVEVTLTNRDSMQFRMLLGRQALKKHAVVHPGRSFLLGRNQDRPVKGHRK